LFKIADELLKQGYSISFDAPAHGKSPGKTTIMVDFITTILEIDKQFGPFDAAIWTFRNVSIECDKKKVCK
jgi:hypothetical protein